MDSKRPSVSPQLLGQLLSTGLGGYAGSAARAFLEQQPEVEARVGPGAFDLWKVQFEERLSELAAALAFENPDLFVAGSHWGRVAYRARRTAVDPLKTGLRVLEAELCERLPEGSDSVLAPYFETASAAVGAAEAGDLEMAQCSRDALAFLAYTLDGQARHAAQMLVDAHLAGAPIAELFEEVVVPAQREVGDLWHRGEINVAEEHLATFTTQKAIAILGHHASAEPANGKIAVVSSVIGDSHDLGLRLLSELYSLAGWRCVPLGADVPRIDLLQALDGFDADLLVLSGTLARHLFAIRATIEAVRQHARSPVKILVGGRAFSLAADLWQKVGADGWGASLSDAVAEGERLVGIR